MDGFEAALWGRKQETDIHYSNVQLNALARDSFIGEFARKDGMVGCAISIGTSEERAEKNGEEDTTNEREQKLLRLKISVFSLK